MNPASPNLVEAWFGADFSRLHPLLQDLHRHGGTLAGPVAIRLGRGLGGWHWRPRRVRLGRVPMPGWLAPRITAHKDIVDGRYRFVVATALPGLGTLLAYQGDLATAPAAT